MKAERVQTWALHDSHRRRADQRSRVVSPPATYTPNALANAAEHSRGRLLAWQNGHANQYRAEGSFAQAA